MNKPLYLLPFILVYKAVAFLIRLPFKIIKYFNIGFFITLVALINIIVTAIYYFIKLFMLGFTFVSYLLYRFLRYVGIGIVVISRFVYRFIRYVCIGICAPFIYLVRWFDLLDKHNKKVREKRALEAEKRAIAKEHNKQIEEENRKRLLEVRAKEKEALEQRKQEQKQAREELKEKLKADIYINEDITKEKKTVADHLNTFFATLGTIPQKIKDIFENNHFAKDARNKKDINRQALLLDFEGEDAEKSKEKVMYKYTARTPEGKDITGYFPAYSRVEVHSFLLSEGNEVYSIETNKWIQRLYGSEASYNRHRIKNKDLIFFTTQLSTYIKAGIPLVESLKILSKQFKSKSYSRIFRSMIYDLTMGDNFSDAMSKQGDAFPRLLINMVKASEMTGELPEALDDMAEYFTETDKTRKQMITAMTYPTIVLAIALVAIVFIMVYVVPQFVQIYAGIDGSTLPPITVFVLKASDFLKHKYLWLILAIVLFIGIFYYLYKNVKSFKTFVQWSLMHLPVIGNVVIYNEVTMFTKTFASLLSHNVFITDSMEILNRITSNEIYRMLIRDTITNLAKGEKISLAFKDHWAFPIPAYEMIQTGERTGQLPEMMDKVSNYYQELHRNSVTRIKTFVEPALILFLTVVVGVIVLSIVIPMFEIYNQIQV